LQYLADVQVLAVVQVVVQAVVQAVAQAGVQVVALVQLLQVDNQHVRHTSRCEGRCHKGTDT